MSDAARSRAMVCGLVVVASLVAALCMANLSAMASVIALHAALMITAWSVMIPLGAVVARYYKVTPAQDFPAEVENLFWFNWHRILQYGGIALATIGAVAMLRATGGRVRTTHGSLGLLVMTVAWIQLASPLFRGRKGGPTDARAVPGDPATWRGDHYDMTRRRRLFEAWHKPAGWLLVALAGLTVLLGATLVGAPAWLLALVGGLQGATLCGVLDGWLRRRWVDTYVALWGPDPAHPGNRDRATQ